jgi:hypothetical protein
MNTPKRSLSKLCLGAMALLIAACGSTPAEQKPRTRAQKVGDVKGIYSSVLDSTLDLSDSWDEKLDNVTDVPLVVGSQATSLRELELIAKAYQSGRSLIFIAPKPDELKDIESKLGVDSPTQLPAKEWVEVLVLEKEPDGELNKLTSYLPNVAGHISDETEAIRKETAPADHVFAEDRFRETLKWVAARGARFSDVDTKSTNFQKPTLKNEASTSPYLGQLTDLANARTDVHQFNFQGAQQGKSFNNSYTITTLSWSMYDAAKGESWFYVRRLSQLPVDGLIDQNNERANWPLRYGYRTWLPEEQGKPQDSVFLQTSSPETTENEKEVETQTSLAVGGELNASLDPEIGVDATMKIEHSESTTMADVQLRNYSGQGWDNKNGPLIHAQPQWEYNFPNITASNCSLSRGMTNVQRSTFQPRQEWVWVVKDSYRNNADSLRVENLFQPTLGYVGAFSKWVFGCDWYNESKTQPFRWSTDLPWPHKPSKRSTPKVLTHEGKAELAEFSETLMRRWVKHSPNGGSWTGSTSVRQIRVSQGPNPGYIFYIEQRPRFTPNIFDSVEFTRTNTGWIDRNTEFGKKYSVKNFIPGAEQSSQIFLVSTAKPESTTGNTTYSSSSEQSFGGGVGVGLHGLAIKLKGEASQSSAVAISLPDINIRYLGKNNVVEWLYEMNNFPRKVSGDENQVCNISGPALINYAAFEPEEVWIWKVDQAYADAHPEGLRLRTEVKVTTGNQRSESVAVDRAVHGEVISERSCKNSEETVDTDVPVEDMLIPWLKDGEK